MNRILKFRAWTGKEMKYSCLVAGAQYCDLLSIPTDEEFIKKQYEYDEWKVMQFTGITDTNGKEIWEGDIVHYKHYNVYIKWWSTVSEIPEIKERTEQGRKEFHILKEQIRFNEGAFCFGHKPLSFIWMQNNKLTEKTETGKTYHSDYEEKWWDFEIVGNIFENPELLKYYEDNEEGN